MKRFYQFIVGMMLVVVCSISVAFAQVTSYDIQEKTLNESSLQGRYPVINTGNLLVKDRVNKTIEKIVRDFGEEIQIQRSKGMSIEGTVGYTIKANNDKVFSLIINCETFSKEMAHPDTYSYGLSFDHKGKLIQLNQIIEKNGQNGDVYSVENLNKEIINQVGGEVFSSFENVTEFPQEFYIDNDLNLHVLFQRYEITPYSAGLIDIILK